MVSVNAAAASSVGGVAVVGGGGVVAAVAVFAVLVVALMLVACIAALPDTFPTVNLPRVRNSKHPPPHPITPACLAISSVREAWYQSQQENHVSAQHTTPHWFHEAPLPHVPDGSLPAVPPNQPRYPKTPRLIALTDPYLSTAGTEDAQNPTSKGPRAQISKKPWTFLQSTLNPQP